MNWAFLNRKLVVPFVLFLILTKFKCKLNADRYFYGYFGASYLFLKKLSPRWNTDFRSQIFKLVPCMGICLLQFKRFQLGSMDVFMCFGFQLQFERFQILSSLLWSEEKHISWSVSSLTYPRVFLFVCSQNSKYFNLVPNKNARRRGNCSMWFDNVLISAVLFSQIIREYC